MVEEKRVKPSVVETTGTKLAELGWIRLVATGTYSPEEKEEWTVSSASVSGLDVIIAKAATLEFALKDLLARAEGRAEGKKKF